MRTALISDIHGDEATLRRVLHDIEGQACDRVLCLGDLVDGGERSLEVVRLLREREVRAVRGDNDEKPSVCLCEEMLCFLRALSEEIV